MEGTPPKATPQPAKAKVTVRGRIELLRPEVEGDQSNYDRSMIFICTAGQVIARVVSEEVVDPAAAPPTPPAPATPTTPAPKDVREVVAMATLGRNVTLNRDMTIVADIDGRVLQRSNSVSVEPVLEVRKNVDFATGNVDFKGDVIVHGNVVDLFHVRSTAEVIVDGIVEGAALDVGGDLTVRGGIAAKNKGIVRVVGKLMTRYMTNATVETHGNIIVDKEITNCEVRCGARVEVPNGTVIGGRVSALTGLLCHDLGSPAALKTIIEVGANYQLHDIVVAKTTELEKVMRQLNILREANKHLLFPAGRLTAPQKETATEVLYELQELDTAAKALRAEVKTAVDGGKQVPRAEIHVTHHVHPEVVLRFPLVEAHIATAIKGPVVFVAASVGGDNTIVQLDPISKRAKVLEVTAVLDGVGAKTAALYARHIEGK